MTPDEERALREAWPRTAEALRSMTQRANTARGASWEHGARCATYLLHAADMVEHLLATLDEARTLASIFSCAIGRVNSALGVPGGPTTTEAVSRVLALRRERDAAVEALRHTSEVLRSLALVHCGHDGDEESGQCANDCARCAIDGALAHAASVGGVQ